MRTRNIATLLALSIAAGPAAAQSPIAVRDLGPIEARSVDHFGTVLGVRALSDGKLLVNDGGRRRLVVLDAALSHATVLLDSVALGGQSYGPVASPLIPYPGDSSLFVDGASSSLLLISASGSIVRALAAPKPSILSALAGGASGIDAAGRLVYSRTPPLRMERTGPELTATQPADSAVILRADFESRTVDTIGRIKAATGTRGTVSTAGGRTVNTMIVSPLSFIDEWAVLSDGSVAFVRGHDYHVDVLLPTGTMVSSAKLPFDWKRLSDADKQGLIDSARTAYEKSKAASRARDIALNGKETPLVNGPPQVVGSYTLIRDYVPLTEIPDYWPPIRAGAARADLDANLWILPTTSLQSKNGELVYDVVNNRGELFQRVRIPSGRSIAGFGHNGIVYLMSRDDAGGWRLERTSILPRANPR